MPTPEWLRPVSERYLGGELGPPPLTVRVASVLSAICAALAAGMAQIMGGIVLDGWMLGVSLPLMLTGLVLLGVCGAATVMISRRGWFRAPLVCGLVLGGLALAGLLGFGPGLISATEMPESYEIARHLTLPFAVTTAAAFALVLVLRTDSASSWLAKRRYQHRQQGQQDEVRQ